MYTTQVQDTRLPHLPPRLATPAVREKDKNEEEETIHDPNRGKLRGASWPFLIYTLCGVMRSAFTGSDPKQHRL